MSDTEYGNVLIGLAGSPISIQSVVPFLETLDDALVVPADDLINMLDTPSGLIIVPDVKTFSQKNHLMGLRGYLLWLSHPQYAGAWTPKTVKEAREAAENPYKEFNASDCHVNLDMTEDWKRKVSTLLAALQYRASRI